MSKHRGYPSLFTRHPTNPILTASDWPYPVHTVFNPGAVRLVGGTTLLLCRVEDPRITFMEDLGKYAVAYTAFTKGGPGVALALDRPDRCLARSDSWIFGPEASYETIGDVSNVTFPCGYTVGDDGDTLNTYYGAADTCIGLATGSIRDILSWLEENDSLTSYSIPPPHPSA